MVNDIKRNTFLRFFPLFLALLFASCSSSERIATPVIDPASGAVAYGTSATITCDTSDAEIYYTTDGSDPTESSTLYTTAISITADVTIKAKAFKTGYDASEVTTATYTISNVVAAPIIDPASGAIAYGTSATITCSTADAEIYYTSDGSDPTQSSTLYTTAISLTAAVTIKAKAFKTGYDASEVATATYTIRPIAFIGGTFTTYNGATVGKLAKLGEDGLLDASFDTTTGVQGGPAPAVRSIAVQSDGKVLIGGLFAAYNGTAVGSLARLNTDGSLDTSFDITTGTNDRINSIAVQSDGKVLIGGKFTSYKGTAVGRLARLNTDGSLDTSFDTTTGTNGEVWSVAIQSDGKILIGGNFASYNGTALKSLARLNTNGLLDATFVTTTGANNIVWSITVIAGAGNSDKIFIGGAFTSYNGTAVGYLARVNATDGSLNTSFDTTAGTNNVVKVIIVQSDHKVLIGGQFTSYNDGSAHPIGYLARLNTDGSLDASFDTSTGADSKIDAIAAIY